MQASRMRLFAGLAISGPALQRLTQLRLRVATPKDGLRWTQPEQWHITLRFFGDVSGDAAEQLSSALTRLRTPNADIRMAELGTFQAKGILFAAVDPSPALVSLQAEVELCASGAGLLPETRRFHPHVTLARSRNRAGLTTIQRFGQPSMLVLGPELRWWADEVLLYESVLGAEGAEYRVRERFGLHSSG